MGGAGFGRATAGAAGGGGATGAADRRVLSSSYPVLSGDRAACGDGFGDASAVGGG